MRQFNRPLGTALAAALLLATTSCAEGGKAPATNDPDGGDTDTTPVEPTSIVVMPPGAVLEVIDGEPATQAYTALAQYASGSPVDVTGQVAFQISPGPLGWFSGNLLTTSDTRSGPGQITATLGNLSGQTAVSVIVRTTQVTDSAPEGASGAFGGTEDPARAPDISYPLDGVLLPPNLADVKFQWSPGAGNDVWRLAFATEWLDIQVFTGDIAFVPEGLLWDQISAGNAGGDAVQVTVSGAAVSDPAQQGVSEPVTVAFAEENVEGGIYYWAASSTQAADYGIFRHDFGKPGQQAEQIYTTAQTNGRCVACHALSHDGTRMALNYDGGNGPADIIDVATRTSVVPAENAYYANFHAYSPDDTLVLSVYQGIFTLRDGSTGAVVEILDLEHVTYPDWSADGTLVAFTRCTRPLEGFNDWTFHGGQIELMTWDGPGAWGDPEVLVPAIESTNLYYPAISPDGRWVLFNRSSDLGAYAGAGDSYSDDDAELWVVSVDGGDPIRLDAINLTGSFRTSWAKWNPEVASHQGQPLMWLTVSSMRGYGHTLADGELPQIWMAAFDPQAAEDGEDPTWPAFYLPFQDITTNNHIAQWTEVVVDIVE
jgi:hypothetical protein